MKKFQALAVVTAAAVYLQVVLGSVVRITGSGLGCRDWPLCYQHETDRFAYRTLLEVAHRLFGTAAGVLVLATAASAFLLLRRRPGGFPRGLWLASAAALGLYIFQAILGGVTVLMKNSPFTVAIHLGNAELVLAVLLLVALWASRVGAAASPDRGVSMPLAVIGMAGAFLIVVTGAIVVGTGASSACPSWPLCGASGGLADAHMLHRAVVLVASIAILASSFRAATAWRGRPLGAVAVLTAALLLLEAGVGAFQVLLGLPPALRSLHVALASGVWAGTVLLVAGAWLEGRGRMADLGARPRLSPLELTS
ncbi:MAG: heme A synthase [Candidatus Dormibacteria bacterium]